MLRMTLRTTNQLLTDVSYSHCSEGWKLMNRPAALSLFLDECLLYPHRAQLITRIKGSNRNTETRHTVETNSSSESA